MKASCLNTAALAAWFVCASAAGAAPLSIFVSIPPQAYLVERIAGEDATVQALIQQGQDPHTFEAAPRQMAALAKADAYFELGALPFEAQMVEKIRAVNPALRIESMSQGIALREIEEHGHEGEEAHHVQEGGKDPHIWLDPARLKAMAENTVRMLAALHPEHSAVYQTNGEALRQEIERADAHARAALEPYKGETFFVYHPAFGYFADAYGLHQEALEIEGKSPSPRELQAIIAEARAAGAKAIFVQPGFDTKSAEAIASAIGGAVAPLDDLARNTPQNIENMASSIKSAFEPKDAPNAQP